MFDSVIFESGNRKVIGEAYDVNGNVHNVLRFFENDKEVLFARLQGRKFIGFNTKNFKVLSAYNYIRIFLEQGIKSMTVYEIEKHLKENGRTYWQFVIFFENGMEYEHVREQYYYYYNGSFLLFKNNNKIYKARLKSINLSYRDISKFSIKSVEKHISEIIIPESVNYDHSTKSKYFMYKNCKIYISDCLRFENYISDIEYLNKFDYFSTGNLFNMSKKTEVKLAKYRMAYGKEPILLGIDSKGYAIFDGIEYPSVD